MKKSNKDRKFNNQVNHLHSFIGIPLWNGRNPTLSEIREYDRRLIEQQTQAVAPKKKSFLKILFRRFKAQSSNASALVLNTKIKGNNLKHELSKPIKTEAECCG